jgi:surface protein
MEYMFSGCALVSELDVSKWNTAKVTSMEFMFNGCVGLTELDLSNWNTALVKDSEQMFAGCSNLKTISVGDNWDMSQVEEVPKNGNQEKLSSDNMFYGCVALEGGAGTKYNETNPTNKTYARIDTPEVPGYLTYKPAAESTNP